jgi:Notch 1
LQTDVNNCGKCGNVCIFTGSAHASCSDGECVMGACNDGRYDLDGDPDNGCEYACTPTGDERQDCETSSDPDCGSVEYCDNWDNDCDGIKDNGFDLNSDPENCGVCKHECELLHASSECTVVGGLATCVVDDCEAGWNDANELHNDGCEYPCTPTGKNGVACPTDPNDPDFATCGTIEYCDSVDNDCNNQLNDGNEASGGPEGGEPCYDFPYCDKKTKTCQGECTPGISTCAGSALVCIPGKTPQLEICDTLDNDCDSKPDNGFVLETDTLNCGACGKSCVDALPNAVAKCKNSKCSKEACKIGYADLTAAPGCEYKCPKFPTSAETCNGIDDDCDGVVDNPTAIAGQKPNLVAFCNNGRPLGTTPCANATLTCDGLGGWGCHYPNANVEVDPVTKKVRVVRVRLAAPGRASARAARPTPARPTKPAPNARPAQWRTTRATKSATVSTTTATGRSTSGTPSPVSLVTRGRTEPALTPAAATSTR